MSKHCQRQGGRKKARTEDSKDAEAKGRGENTNSSMVAIKAQPDAADDNGDNNSEDVDDDGGDGDGVDKNKSVRRGLLRINGDWPAIIKKIISIMNLSTH